MSEVIECKGGEAAVGRMERLVIMVSGELFGCLEWLWPWGNCEVVRGILVFSLLLLLST